MKYKTEKLSKKISSLNPDVICIEKVFSDEVIDNLYKMLKEDYAHFFYLRPSLGSIDCIEHYNSEALLIASKYPIENVQFNKFKRKSTDGGFFDFIIKNQEEPLAHIYIANFINQEIEKVRTKQFLQILDQMNDDFIEAQEDSIAPFIICGNLKNLKNSLESCNLINKNFYEDTNRLGMNSLILKTIPNHSSPMIKSEYAFLSSSVELLDCCNGLLLSFKKVQPNSLGSLFDIEGKFTNENYTLLAGGEVEISVRQDSEGNTSAKADVSYSGKSDDSDTKYSLGADVEVKRDSDGNINTSVEISGTFSW